MDWDKFDIILTLFTPLVCHSSHKVCLHGLKCTRMCVKYSWYKCDRLAMPLSSIYSRAIRHKKVQSRLRVYIGMKL